MYEDNKEMTFICTSVHLFVLDKAPCYIAQAVLNLEKLTYFNPKFKITGMHHYT